MRRSVTTVSLPVSPTSPSGNHHPSPKAHNPNKIILNQLIISLLLNEQCSRIIPHLIQSMAQQIIIAIQLRCLCRFPPLSRSNPIKLQFPIVHYHAHSSVLFWIGSGNGCQWVIWACEPYVSHSMGSNSSLMCRAIPTEPFDHATNTSLFNSGSLSSTLIHVDCSAWFFAARHARYMFSVSGLRKRPFG